MLSLWGLSCGASTPAALQTEAAVPMLERALGKIGSPAALEGFGSFELRATGTLDKNAEGQGLAPDRPSPGPYREAFAFDPRSGRVAWDYREERHDGTLESFREAYPGPQRRLIVIQDPPLAIPAVSERFAENRLRLTRRLPHLALAELLERDDDLRVGERRDDRIVVEGNLTDGTRLRVELDAGSDLPRRLSYVASLSSKGETEVAWWFDDYRPVEGLGLVPFRYGSTVGGQPYTDMTVEAFRPGVLELFEVPEGHRELPERRLEEAGTAEPAPLKLEPLEPGVFRAPEVRGGFAPLVVALEGFTVVVDAPASFPLLGKVPAEETDPAPSFSWHAERLVDAIAAELPDRPLRYLVLTHAHEDHVGGVRAFVAAGATVLAAPAVKPVVERLVGLPASAVRDRLGETADAQLRFEAIEAVRMLGGEQGLELIPMGDNPHAEGMLVVHLPGRDLLFVSDFVTPGDLDAYPRPSHAALDRFFVSWLDRSGLSVDRVMAMHGAPFLTREHLARARAAKR